VKSILNNMDGWRIDAVTAVDNARIGDHVKTHHVSPRVPERYFSLFRRLHLDKFLDWLVWPDAQMFWVLPAYLRARELTRRNEYDAVLVFMMPYSSGLAGIALKRRTGLPLVLNLDDSPTCSDLHPTHPSRLHYWLAQKLEDLYAQTADAVVYVSRRNMERVRERQPRNHRHKFHLVRYGSQPLPSGNKSSTREDDTFRIVYTGGTVGWYKFLDDHESSSFLERVYRAWKQAGRHEVADLDPRTHNPVFAGRAVKRLVDEHPEWCGRIQIDVYGKRYPKPVTDTVLDKYGLQNIVNLHGEVPHEEALKKMAEGDLLFMALPDRPDGSPGGRISAKTYEYLRTDRPILAALPPGENQEYLADKSGVHLTPPDGIEEMGEVISRLATAKFDGHSIEVERSELQSSLSNGARAQRFERIVSNVAEDSSSVRRSVAAAT
jgi:glycosyltransferase involved in cell wall biosynthesis